MKKLLILVAVVVLFSSGCVDEKTANTDSPKQETTQSSSNTQSQQTQSQQTQSQPTQAQSQPEDPAASPTQNLKEDATIDETKETLQELEGLLEELKDGDFADINFSE